MPASKAAQGDLDTTFGNGGKVVTDFGGTTDYLFTAKLQNDGKIIVGGRASKQDVNGYYHSDLALARYYPDGSLDASFGDQGRVLDHFNGGEFDRIADLALQSDGRIVAVGNIVDYSTSSTAIAVVRYNTDGSPDKSFGLDSRVITHLGGTDDEASAVAIQPDGKLVVAGRTGNSSLADVALVRYNPNGSLDPGFGSAGAVVTHLDGGYNTTAHANDVVVQPDGKLVVGSAYQQDFGRVWQLALTRYNPNGSLDPTFGTNGKVIAGFANYALALSLQPDGKILAVGDLLVSYHNRDIVLARFNPDGQLDTSFGSSGGWTMTAFTSTSNDIAYALARQTDGRIVVAGQTGTTTVTDFALLRYTSDGQLDATFGNGGKVSTDFLGMSDQIFAVLIQPNGRIVVAGNARQGTSDLDFALARYLSVRASTVSDFNGDGRTEPSIFCPGDGTWSRLDVAAGSVSSRQWGGGTDRPVPGDYDGDGTTDLAVFRPSDGNWYILNSATGSATLRNWGASGDRPVPADYDGDGRTDLAVFRPSEGNWYIVYSSTNTVRVQGWGDSTDKLVPGDYDGDGRADIAVFRPSDGNWYIINSSNNSVTFRSWGGGEDQPTPGDYDGDGRTDVAVFRSADGNWYIVNSATNTATVRNWGGAGDQPVPGDYDGDGRADIAIFRPIENNWYVIRSADNTVATFFLGGQGDMPLPWTYVSQ